VVVVTEMIHDARIVPLDGRPHLHPAITQWAGNSRGHWEGDTLLTLAAQSVLKPYKLRCFIHRFTF
jgi:hypothetical protein